MLDLRFPFLLLRQSEMKNVKKWLHLRYLETVNETVRLGTGEMEEIYKQQVDVFVLYL